MRYWYAIFTLFFIACQHTYAADITGAGASFPAPIYAKWAHAYNKQTGKQINYQSIGSGAGIKQIQAKTVDFGASDMPLKNEELLKNNLTQFPTLIGGVVPIVHLPQIGLGELVLDGQVLADIFLGKIKRWNDAQIQRLNPTLTLPTLDIQVVHRADASGTSFLFTHYLAQVNDEWKNKIGSGTSVNWPVGVAGKGNEGCAVFVQRLKGAISYVEYAYVKQNKLNYVKLKNTSGEIVSPGEQSFHAAASDIDWSQSTYRILTNVPQKNAWPITGATFVLLQKVQNNPIRGRDTLAFFDWAYGNGAQMASELGYVPLNTTSQNHIRTIWKEIKDQNQKSVY